MWMRTAASASPQHFPPAVSGAAAQRWAESDIVTKSEAAAGDTARSKYDDITAELETRLEAEAKAFNAAKAAKARAEAEACAAAAALAASTKRARDGRRWRSTEAWVARG